MLLTMQKIVLSQQDEGFGQVGGGAFLNDLSLWPVSPESGELLTPLLTLTERFRPARWLPPGMAVTLFIAARQLRDGDFSHNLQRRYTVNQPSELQEVIKNGYARVILHELAEKPIVPSDHPLLLQSAFIDFEEMTDDELEDEHAHEDSGIDLSKPSGRPGWLQDPIYPPDRYMFLMQLADGDVTEASPQHDGLLAEGIGYVFLDMRARRGKEGDEAGFFFIQFT